MRKGEIVGKEKTSCEIGEVSNVQGEANIFICVFLKIPGEFKYVVFKNSEFKPTEVI